MRSLTVWISADSARRLRNEATKADDVETGGVLMGYTSDDHDTIVITDLIGPGTNATHRRTSFSPDLDFQERAIARIYRSSNRKTTYLGDWHSHPGGGHRLSGIDRRTLRRIRDHADARISEPLMIVAHARAPWDLTVWRLQRRARGYGSRLRHTQAREF